jgi:hypothetical protein
MRHAGAQVELYLDTGPAEAQSVGEVLVAEDVQLPDLDVGRRQLGRIGDARGCGGGGHVRAAGRVSQQGAPAGDVVVILPQDCRTMCASIVGVRSSNIG